MEEVRKRLDSVEVPFTGLLQDQPQLRSYFMRISRAIMNLSEIPKEEWSPELLERIERIVSSSANELESVLNAFHRT